MKQKILKKISSDILHIQAVLLTHIRPQCKSLHLTEHTGQHFLVAKNTSTLKSLDML